MIKISLSDSSFFYDAYNLVKAFSPKEECEFTDESPDIVLCPGESGDRLGSKNKIKRELYTHLRERYERDLPWGVLTGIRPVKIPAKLLKEGLSEEKILEILKSEYFISEKKAALALEIAKKEREILKGIDSNTHGCLYVGVPFCPSICAYCSFSSYPVKTYKDRVHAYVDALCKELEFTGGRYKKKIKCIYIGGGTPTSLEAEDLLKIGEYIKSSFDLSELQEFCVECGRPDSITEEKLKALKSLGVDRISINPQSMWEPTLQKIGRKHTPEEVISAFNLSRELDFKNINCDLIAGLPGEGSDEIKYTLNKIEELEPESLTVHCLAIKRASRLNEEGFFPEWELKEEDMRLFSDCARKLSMEPYYLYRQKNISGNFENIGYSKEGLHCLYNILIMGEYTDIIAAGSGGVSKFLSSGKPERVFNVKDVDLYIEKLHEMTERKAPWL